MDILLWVAQGLLAVMFLMAGLMKLMRPKEMLREKMGFVEDFSQTQVRLIGLLEVLAALGLLLPGLLGVLPALTPLAAVGLVLVMIGAMLTHLRRKEPMFMVVNAVLLVLAAFVAYGRFMVEPLG